MKMNVDEISNAEPATEKEEFFMSRIWNLLIQEARAVSLWSCVSIMLRLALIFLSALASYRDDKSVMMRWFGVDLVQEEFMVACSVLAGWILCLVPSKVLTQQAPGFVFSNPGLLLWVRDKTGVIPNLPTRACEYVLGRISLVDLIIIQPIHMVSVVSTSVFLQRVFPEDIANMALEPVEYSDSSNPWIVDLSREILVTAGFTVAMLILPVLFRLNDLPRWSMIFFFYPLFQFTVDGQGMASAFSPNVLLALNVLGYRPFPAGYRLMGSLLGGLIGGKVMQKYFPDQTKN